MKKITSILTLVAIGFVTLVNASSTYDYQDMLDAANNLSEQSIINDHSNDPENYNLYSNILRQEVSAVTRGVAGLEKKTTCDNIFKDVSATNPNTWACYNIEVLVDNNLISKNEYFRPEDSITKAETLGMLIKAIGYDYSYNSNSSKTWQEQIVDYAVSKGVVDNFTDYNVEAPRGWVFMVADTTIKVYEEEYGADDEDDTYSDEA